MISYEFIARWLIGGAFSLSLIEESNGFISFLIEGSNAKEIFEHESGGHRFQRKSPTDAHGRIHTSTITVAVLDVEDEYDVLNFKDQDVEITTTRGSGPGGQNRNKVESCVVATHIPTGITVRIDGRSQHHNKLTALRILKSKIGENKKLQEMKQINSIRKEQVGSGMRGDKVKTYREKDNVVIDHKLDKKIRLDDWLKGDWK